MVSKNKKSQNSNLILFAPKGVYRSLTQLCHAKIAGPDPAEQKEPHVASTCVTRQGRERRTECVSVGTTGQSVPVCVCVCVCVYVLHGHPGLPVFCWDGSCVVYFFLVGGRFSLGGGGGSQPQHQPQTNPTNKKNNTTTAAATTITPQRQPQRQPQQQGQQQATPQHLDVNDPNPHKRERGRGERGETEQFCFCFLLGGGSTTCPSSVDNPRIHRPEPVRRTHWGESW
jgi:hypothetical protein